MSEPINHHTVLHNKVEQISMFVAVFPALHNHALHGADYL
jgi:hypothetical protein